MAGQPTAAVVTVGTELTTGLRQDTNTTIITRSLTEAGFRVLETRSVPDDQPLVAAAITALVGSCDLVVVTGGLGPTHDDITREAASQALGRSLVRHEPVAEALRGLAVRHEHPGARSDMLRQADVLEGAAVLPAATGSAPGQVVSVGTTRVVLLPGPPGEMRPLLERVLSSYEPALPPARLRCTGITESDAQQVVQAVIADFDVDLTLLAAPGDVEVVLFPREHAPADLRPAAAAAAAALGDFCYSTDGSSLAEVVIARAIAAGEGIATAESCTGGMIAAALTDVPGASAAYVGGVVAYANEVKLSALDVPPGLLAQYGAVSEQVACAMAEGALQLPGATIAVATTGIAGPEGGSADKPVGLVWIALGVKGGPVVASAHKLRGDRAAVRHRAMLIALDLLRRELMTR